jgi:hypothetical protein
MLTTQLTKQFLRELSAGVGNPDCAGTCPISSPTLKVWILGRSIHCSAECMASSVIQRVDCTASPFTFSQTESRIWGRESCFLEYHNDSFFGLTVEDCKVIQKRKSDWTPPSATKKKVQKRHIDSLIGSSAYITIHTSIDIIYKC